MIRVPEKSHRSMKASIVASRIFCDNPYEASQKTLEKYQPKKLINQWIKMFNCGDYTGLVSGLIRHHYDPLYRKNLHQTIQNAKSSGLFHSLHLDSVDKSTIQKKLIPQLLDLAYSTPTTATTTTASAADPHSHRHHHRDDDNSVNDCRSIAGI
ncbi:unnamed protein product [Trichobilharzia regenti]|nr:unnamed protein product [Trichobilharzia regenti]